MEGIAVWKKEADDKDGWNANVLTLHKRKIQALLFHPHSLLLASAADDGWLCLWTKAKQVGQILEGARSGFSCLAWSQDGQKLAAGDQDGELIVWSESKRGKGFGRSAIALVNCFINFGRLLFKANVIEIVFPTFLV